MMLYALGLKTGEEITDSLKAAANHEQIEIGELTSWSYEDIMNLDFRVILDCNKYQLTGGKYIDATSSEAGLKYLYDSEDAIKLKVVGVVRASDDAVASFMANTAVAYTSALTEHIINTTNESDIVKSQLADPETDVILGLKFRKEGEELTLEEINVFKTAVLKHCAKQYVRLNWAMQLHIGALRNNNTKMYNKLGPDTGFDVIGPNNCSQELAKLMDRMNCRKLPKTILYSLDSTDNSFIDTLLGAFQGEGYPGTIQHGSAWWFNDTKNGMREQMKSLASLGLLGNFVGMLTDSRSFLSYTRHEYFRRILCELVGSWVENGEYPDDDEALAAIVEGICYTNAKKYFGL